MKREELQLENECCMRARQNGVIAVKLEKNAHTGIPDRVFIKRGGECMFVEFKKPGGGRISDGQRFYADFIGKRHFFIDNIKDFLQILDDFIGEK